MTLMPVWNISVLDSSLSYGGEWRWMGQRTSASKSGSSRAWPSTLNTCPVVFSPTGTVIDSPVSVTGAPRTRPSVGCMAMARTVLSPRCCATSQVMTVVCSPIVRSTVTALKIAGISSGANSTSITGPMTRTIRPVPCCVSCPTATVAMFVSAPGLLEGFRASDDLHDLLGDLRLPRLVVLPGELLDQLLGVVGGGAHRLLPGGVLGGGRLEHRGEHARLDVAGQQGVQHRLGVRLVDVHRDGLLRPLAGLLDDERDEPGGGRALRHGRDVVGEHGMDLVHLMVEERLEHRVGDPLGVLVGGPVGEARPRLGDRALPEPVVGEALAADHVEPRLGLLLAQPGQELLGGAQDVGVVGTGEAPV